MLVPWVHERHRLRIGTDLSFHMTSPEVTSAFGGDAVNAGIDFHDGDGHGLVPSSHVSPFFARLSL